MNVVPVLFEDHSLTGFRPLAWSLPVYEIRMGMFSLRERVGHLLGGSREKGVLLGRPVLEDLQRASGWVQGEDVRSLVSVADTRFLWLNGRADWGHQELARLLEKTAAGEDLVIRDDLGLVAASCSGETALDAVDSWRRWEEGVSGKGGWKDPHLPVEPWSPAFLAAGKASEPADAPAWIWQIVPRTRKALAADLEFLKTGFSYLREPFGVVPAVEESEAVWSRATRLVPWSEAGVKGPGSLIHLVAGEDCWCGPDVSVGAGVTIDATAGPVILDRGVTVMPNCRLEGPLYLGPGSLVKAGAALYGESSFGIVNRVAGEIGESTFGDFANKQHDGFIGHAVLGSWVNLGAMTTCSDLKNNYGSVRVDLGNGQIDSGERFVGLLMGDHAKTAIGTLFNTGTSVGFASNIFGGGMPPKFVGNFRWGGAEGGPAYEVARALETAEVVMSRRGCRLTEGHRQLFHLLGG